MLAMTTAATIAVMFVTAKWATTIPEVAMCVVASIWALIMLTGRRVQLAWVIGPLLGIGVLAALQIVTGSTVYAWPTRMAALYWTGNLATFFVALQFLAERELRVRYMDGLVAFAGFAGVFCTIHAITSIAKVYWTYPPGYETPLFGPFIYANQYAAFVELILPVAIYGALTREKWARIGCVLAAAILFGSVLFSASRGGTALTLLEIAGVPLLTARRRGITRQQLVNTGLVLAVAVLWVVVAAGPDKLLAKINDPGTYGSRMEFNRASLSMIKDRPIQGFGLWNWATVYPGYAAVDDGFYANQAHNDWAQWTVEGGIPMLALMLAVAVWAVPRAIRSGWGVGVLMVLIHCLWDYPIQRTGVAIVFFTMMAAIAPYGRPKEREEEPQPEEDAFGISEAAMATGKRLSSMNDLPFPQTSPTGGVGAAGAAGSVTG